MRSKEFMNEAPLPDDWDSKVFSPKNAFKQQVDYALANSKKLGAGSSRVVTSIEFMGRQTALKIAKNKKGLAQNEAELEICNDRYAKQMQIIVPLIDWDKENNPPRWLQFEQAQKASEKQLCSLMKCVSLYDMCVLAAIRGGDNSAGGPKHEAAINQRWHAAGFTQDDREIFDEYVNDLAELSNSFAIELVDFSRPQNWGIYKGRPVVIDIGFTSGVSASHYS